MAKYVSRHQQKRFSDLNFLTLLGRPLFRLFLSLVILFASLILLLKYFLSTISLSSLLTWLDQFITQVFSRLYLEKPPTLRPRPSLPRLSLSRLILILLFLALAFLFYRRVLYQLPSPASLADGPQKLTTQILDRNGRLLYKIYQDENRTPVKLKDLPLYVKQAFLAIEDNDFYQHTGFSITGIFRAITKNLNLKCTISNVQCPLEGGSTITQQLVKNALLTPEKTWTRKIKEIILAIATEIKFDKDTILEMYFNQVGFGGPAYGIQEASRQYFNVDAINLTLAQAAFLAGLPKAPSKFSPYINPALSLERQRLVLNQMLRFGYINHDQLEEALNEPLRFINPKIEIRAPHFVMYVRDLLVDQFGEALVSHGGLKVTTSLDLDLQTISDVVVRTELERLKGLNVGNGAALITRPASGEILAMTGSRDYFDLSSDGQVNLTTALRQPGSAIKPVNYALALEKGTPPNTMIKDEPVSFNLPGTGLWTPQNYDGRFHGTISLRTALANSYNIPAILLLARNGVANMVELGKKMGLTTWDQPPERFGLSLTLGSVEVKMTDMAVVYGTFANNGLTVPVNPILKIENSQGEIIPFNPCSEATPTCLPRQTLKPETAFLISDILADNAARAAAFGFNSVLNLGRYQAAVKTGTSNDLRDNWTFGFTPDYVVATWVGNNDNSPMSRVASGITGASPIWASLMKNLLAQNPRPTLFSPPGNLVRLPICTLTGTLTCEGCPTRYEYFPEETAPRAACDPETIKRILEEQAHPTVGPTPSPRILGVTN